MAGASSGEDEGGAGYWPGFVDALANLVLFLIFIFVLITVAFISISVELSKRAVVQMQLSMSNAGDGELIETNRGGTGNAQTGPLEGFSPGPPPGPTVTSEQNNKERAPAGPQGDPKPQQTPGLARAATPGAVAPQAPVPESAMRVEMPFAAKGGAADSRVEGPVAGQFAGEPPPPRGSSASSATAPNEDDPSKPIGALARNKSETIVVAATPQKPLPPDAKPGGPRTPLLIEFPGSEAVLDDASARRIRETVSSLPADAPILLQSMAGVPSGSPSEAERLAYYRAIQVRNALIAAGVRPDRIRTKLANDMSGRRNDVVLSLE